MLYRDRVFVKVHGVPFQSQHLASAQPVESCEHYRYFELCPFDSLKKKFHLLCIIKAAFEAALPGTFDLIRRVCRYKVKLYGVFQRLVNVRVIVDNRIRAHPFQLCQVEILDILCRKVHQFYLASSEIRGDCLLHHH